MSKVWYFEEDFWAGRASHSKWWQDIEPGFGRTSRRVKTQLKEMGKASKFFHS